VTIPDTSHAVLRVLYRNDPADPWQEFGHYSDFGALKRTRRVALKPGQTVTARYWSIIKDTDDDLGTGVARIHEVKFWKEAAALEDDADRTAVKLVSFNFDDAQQRYLLVQTEGNIEVYRQGERQCSIPTPYGRDQVRFTTRAQARDTMIGFHPDVAPQRFMRQGAHDQWDSRALEIEKVPVFDFDGRNTGATSEIQDIEFIDYADGDLFVLTLEGENTEAISWNSDGPTTAAAIKAKLESLDIIGADNVDVALTGGSTWRVTFKGELLGQDMGQMAVQTVRSTDGFAHVSTAAQGKPGGEAVMSVVRGWPACGTFYQQRLHLAGLKSRPETWLASGVGVYYNFDFAPAEKNGSIDENMDTDQVTQIVSVFPGQHLQFFTQSAEFFVAAEPIVPPAPVKQATRRGVALGTPQVAITDEEGAMRTLFVGAGRSALHEFGFAFEKDNYVSPNLAVDAGHIVQGVIDLALREHRSTEECDLAVLVRDTGAAAVMVALREQQILGFVPWTTAEGGFLAAASELKGDVYVATWRNRPEGDVRVLERMDPARFLDSSVLGEVGASTVSGLGHLEGLTVALYVDGGDGGDAVVTGGQVTLPFPARHAPPEVGLNFRPRGRTLPAVLQQDPRSGASMAPRAGEIAFELGPTAGLKAGLPGGKMWRVPLKRWAGALLDQGPGENAFAGWTRLDGVQGFRTDAQVEWVQERPGPLEIKQLVVTVSS